MNIFATVVASLGKDLLENLTVLSANLRLLKTDKDDQLAHLYDAYKLDVSDSLLGFDDDNETLTSTLKLLIGALRKNRKSDTEQGNITMVFLINKLSGESSEIAEKMITAIYGSNYENETLQKVAKNWEIYSPIDELVDPSIYNAVIKELDGTPLDIELMDQVENSESDKILECVRDFDAIMLHGDYKRLFSLAEDQYIDLFRKMNSLQEKVYLEMIHAAESPQDAIDIHQAMNGAMGSVKVSDLKIILNDSLVISKDIRKLVAHYIEMHENFGSSLLRNNMGRLNVIIKEKISYAKFCLQCFDRLDLLAARSYKILEGNVSKLIKVKTSTRELFDEMIGVISEEQIKKAS